jgi:hypothetical protein
MIEAIACMREPRPPLLWVGNLRDDDLYVEELRRFVIDGRELIDILNRARLMVYAPKNIISLTVSNSAPIYGAATYPNNSRSSR